MDTWIWTELLAFDNAAPDLGVEAYFASLQATPQGITLLLTAVDFVLQHENWTAPHILPADVCSRMGHSGNGLRDRQQWDSEQLKRLVAQLHRKGCKVVFSLFCYYLADRFHHEWATDHPECLTGWDDGAVNLLAPLKDGTLLEDLFVRKLMEVEEYYGFDGWHGPDTCGPGWPVFNSYYGNAFVAMFRDWLGSERLPAQYRQDLANREQGKQRMRWIWENLRDEWIDFMNARWLSFWKKILDAMHATGRIALINSPDTKCLFGGLYYLGLDYRAVARLGVDMIVMETTSTGFSLTRGWRDYMTEFAAVMQEMAASMPGVKVCMMLSIKDTVESYDAIRHFRPMFERDYHFLASRQIHWNGQLRRTAEAFMVCLGDTITTEEWEWLKRLDEAACSFQATSAGELTWLHDPNAYEALRAEYRTRGTQEECYQIARLEELGGLDIAVIATPQELDSLDGPLVVPNFHLLDEALKRRILAKRQLVVLTGDLRPGTDYPARATVVHVRLNTGWTFTCAILNSPHSAEAAEHSSPDGIPFDTAPASWNPYAELPPGANVPDLFWKDCAAKIRGALENHPLENGARKDGLFGSVSSTGNEVAIYRQWDKEGRQRIGIYSRVFTYRAPRLRLEEGANLTVQSEFPRGKLCVKDGIVQSVDPFGKPTNLPPCGIIVVDEEKSRDAFNHPQP